MLISTICISASVGRPHSSTRIKEQERFKNMDLALVSQRWRPKEQALKYDPIYSDNFELDPDDYLLVSFRLTNKGAASMYYLASIYDTNPVRYQLFRKAGEVEWKATNTARGREGDFTGGGYRWLILPPGHSVEFEVPDLSTLEDEHAVSVLVNEQPKHRGRVEIISDTYRPMRRDEKE
jgi:hypothetical protein